MTRIPRKIKKIFKVKCPSGMKSYTQLNFNYAFNKRMVIVHNYVIGGIPLTLTKEDKNFINTGLLTNKKFKSNIKHEKIMKTAEEIYIEFGCSKKSEIISAMKEYASVVANNTLIDGRENIMKVYKASGMTNMANNASESLMSTEVKLP